MKGWQAKCSSLPALLVVLILGRNVPVVGKSICNLCQPAYHERCQMSYPYPFVFLYGSRDTVVPLANSIAGAVAVNLALNFKVRSPLLRGNYIRPDPHSPNCYAPITSANNDQTLGNWLSLTWGRKMVSTRCHVIFVTQSLLEMFKDQFFAGIPKPDTFLGSQKRLRRAGKYFEDFVANKLSNANELSSHNATTLLSRVHSSSCATSQFTVESLSEWNATVKAFVTSEMGIRNPQKWEVIAKGAHQIPTVPTALSQLRSAFESSYRPSLKLCSKIAQLSWTKNFYPSFTVQECVGNMSPHAER